MSKICNQKPPVDNQSDSYVHCLAMSCNGQVATDGWNRQVSCSVEVSPGCHCLVHPDCSNSRGVQSPKVGPRKVGHVYLNGECYL